MILARTFSTSDEFRAQWSRSVDALLCLHEHHLILPDYRYELAHDALLGTKTQAATNEIERELRRFWEFDERFFGDAPIGGGESDFLWAVYCVAYLFRNEEVAVAILDLYCPLLGPYATKQFGENFVRKVCSTLMDDVGHVLFEVQECEPAHEPDFFDWLGQLNDFPDDLIALLLAKAGLPLLENAGFPLPEVMRVFCSGTGHPEIGSNYRSDLEQFYLEIGSM